MPSTIGELKFIKDGIELEWKISDFFTLTKGNDVKYDSPYFYFAGESWYIQIYPNGSTKNDTVGNINCYVTRKNFDHSVNVKYEIGLKKMDGSMDKTRCSYTSTFETLGWGCKKIISIAELSARMSDLATSNIVTIICKLTSDKEIDSDIRGFSLKGLYQLSDNLKELMLNGSDSDLTVKIKDKEFKLHKCILGIRSPVFLSVLEKEIDYNLDSVVNITDIEEAEFGMFLEYIYTGQVEDILKKNFYSLYKIAEKYQITELKKGCLKVIKQELSEETFFDAVELEEKYDEKELYSLTSKFCADNLKELVESPKWLKFMQENATKAYDMLSKALNNYVKS